MCPLCGKTYKRLKSHLPHCKSATNSTTRSDTSQQKKKSAPLVLDKPAPQSTKTKKTSQLESTPAASLQSEAPLSPSLSPQSSGPAKKKKQKLSDLIKAAAAVSSSSAPLTSVPSPPAALTSSKPKRKRDRALTETTYVGRATHQAAAAPIRPGSNGGDSIHLSADLKAPPVAEVKLQGTIEPSVSLNCQAGESGDDFCGSSRETEDSAVTHLTSKTGSGHQVARITIQDAKATLGRSSRRADVLHQFVLPGSKAEVRAGADLSRVLLQVEPNLCPKIPSSLPPPVQARGSKQQHSTRLLPPQASQATPKPSAGAGSLNEALHTISPILSPLCRHNPPPGGPWMFLGWAEPPSEPGGASRGNNTGGKGATGQWHSRRTVEF